MRSWRQQRHGCKPRRVYDFAGASIGPGTRNAGYGAASLGFSPFLLLDADAARLRRRELV